MCDFIKILLRRKLRRRDDISGCVLAAEIKREPALGQLNHGAPLIRDRQAGWRPLAEHCLAINIAQQTTLINWMLFSKQNFFLMVFTKSGC